MGTNASQPEFFKRKQIKNNVDATMPHNSLRTFIDKIFIGRERLVRYNSLK
jgi:hypothetical protein